MVNQLSQEHLAKYAAYTKGQLNLIYKNSKVGEDKRAVTEFYLVSKGYMEASAAALHDPTLFDDAGNLIAAGNEEAPGDVAPETPEVEEAPKRKGPLAGLVIGTPKGKGAAPKAKTPKAKKAKVVKEKTPKKVKVQAMVESAEWLWDKDSEVQIQLAKNRKVDKGVVVKGIVTKRIEGKDFKEYSIKTELFGTMVKRQISLEKAAKLELTPADQIVTKAKVKVAKAPKVVAPKNLADTIGDAPESGNPDDDATPEPTVEATTTA